MVLLLSAEFTGANKNISHLPTALLSLYALRKRRKLQYSERSFPLHNMLTIPRSLVSITPRPFPGEVRNKSRTLVWPADASY